VRKYYLANKNCFLKVSKEKHLKAQKIIPIFLAFYYYSSVSSSFIYFISPEYVKEEFCMKDILRKSIIKFLSAIGLFVLLLGYFTDVYDFMLGVVIALGIWLIASVIARMWFLDRVERK
jgi:hypothetical protein